MPVEIKNNVGNVFKTVGRPTMYMAESQGGKKGHVSKLNTPRCDCSDGTERR